MGIVHRKEIRKLTFRALALRRSGFAVLFYFENAARKENVTLTLSFISSHTSKETTIKLNTDLDYNKSRKRGI